MSVEIRFSEKKEEGGDLKGAGKTDNGTFSISIAIDPTIPAGKYQVMAHSLPFTIGDTNYLDSWSDPPIIIYTPTSISIQKPAGTLYAGEPIRITGTLVEEVGNLPIEGATLWIEQDGRRVGAVNTDGLGRFSTELTFSNRGPHAFRIGYDGQDFYGPLIIEDELVLWMKTQLELIPPRRALVDQPTTISGRLLDARDSPVTGQRVMLIDEAPKLWPAPPEVLFPVGFLSTATTDAEGRFQLSTIFSDMGDYSIIVRFTRASFFESSEVQFQLPVFMPTDLLINLEAGASGRVSEPMELRATLQDVRGQGIAEAALEFREEGRNLVSLTTSTGGGVLYDWQPLIPGPRRLSIEFSAKGFYLASKREVTISVFMPTTLTFVDPPSQGDAGSPIPLTLELMDVLEEPIPNSVIVPSVKWPLGSNRYHRRSGAGPANIRALRRG